MKRCGTIAALSLVLALLCAGSSYAIFPKPDFPPTGIGLLEYNLHLGWYNNAQAWYVRFDTSTNDVNFARRGEPYSWLSRKLSSALEPKDAGFPIAARPMYIVLNPAATQGPVFSAAPGPDAEATFYSGLWQVFYITWKAGANVRPITNANPGDPLGLPDATEADIVATGIVVQLPVVALGPLGGPWYPAPPGTYRMQQVFVQAGYAQTKMIYLPTYTIFCRDYITRRVERFVVTIPDATSRFLAAQLKANYAPGLINVPDPDTQAFYLILCAPQLCQLPIVEGCPGDIGRLQINPVFSPVVTLVQLNRAIPHATVVNNAEYVRLLISNGGLSIANDENRMGLLFYRPLAEALAPGA